MQRLRRRVAGAAGLSLLLGLLPGALPAGAAHYTNTEELSGEGNSGAAVAFSASTFPEGAEEALLGRDDAFPDSLASGMLQASRPLLLTATDTLSEPTKAELERLQAGTVHILGGTSAVSQAVEDALTGMGLEVVRYSGANRIETAVDVARQTAANATQAILARAFGDSEDESRGFADSLAAGAWAAAAEIPILLTETERLSDATAAYLGDSSIEEVTIVGGNAAVSEEAQTQLAALGVTVKRVSGPTRFHTALAIAAERGFASVTDAQKVILAEGQAQDAWAAGFAAAARSKKDNAPVLLAVGETLPEPTQQFLAGAAGAVALLCAPGLAEATCGAGAEALGQTAQAGGGALLSVTATAVSRFDHAEGKVTNPSSIDELTVTGCGYTGESVYVAEDGTFYLMLAEPAGACSAEFSGTSGPGVTKQTVEFTIGEDFNPSSSLPVPELVHVRPVKLTGEGIELRYVFDEPVAPGEEAIEHDKFGLEWLDNEHLDRDDEMHEPTSFRRDPRNSRAVLMVFREDVWVRTTAAWVDGGELCYDESESAYCNTGGGAEGDPDEGNPGAVRDLDGYPNVTGHWAVRRHDFTAAFSDNPDLLSVGGYDAATQSLVFVFSEAVELPSRSEQEVGAATLVFEDGAIKESDDEGWTAGADDRSLRVAFSGDGLTAEEAGVIRRAYVEDGLVPAQDDGEENTAVAVVVNGGGITVRPDFIGVEDEDFDVEITGTCVDPTPCQQVTYVFEEDIDDIDDDAADLFVAVLRDGTVVEAEQGVEYEDEDENKRKFVATFEDLDETVLYYTVLSGAVRAFDNQLTNFADTIRKNNPVVYDAGETDAPDLTGVRVKHTKQECAVGELDQENGEYEFEFQFDQDVGTVGGSRQRAFQIWWTGDGGSEDDGVPHMTEFLDHTGPTAADDANLQGKGTSRIVWVPTSPPVCSVQGTPDPGPPSAEVWEALINGRVRYMVVEAEAATGEGSGATKNYASGLRVSG